MNTAMQDWKEIGALMAKVAALEARCRAATALLQRCADDPGVAYDEAEQAAMVTLWADVEAFLTDASTPETKANLLDVNDPALKSCPNCGSENWAHKLDCPTLNTKGDANEG